VAVTWPRWSSAFAGLDPAARSRSGPERNHPPCLAGNQAGLLRELDALAEAATTVKVVGEVERETTFQARGKGDWLNSTSGVPPEGFKFARAAIDLSAL
jgi:hypothetical protein